jgi:hypothetical protein
MTAVCLPFYLLILPIVPVYLGFPCRCSARFVGVRRVCKAPWPPRNHETFSRKTPPTYIRQPNVPKIRVVMVLKNLPPKLPLFSTDRASQIARACHRLVWRVARFLFLAAYQPPAGATRRHDNIISTSLPFETLPSISSAAPLSRYIQFILQTRKVTEL